MKCAEITEYQFAKPAQMVVLREVMKISMKTAERRNPEAPRGRDRRPAEKTLGRDVHGVRAPLRPAAAQQRSGRQPYAQPSISGQRQAGDQRRPGIIIAGGEIGALPRAYDRHRMPLRA